MMTLIASRLFAFLAAAVFIYAFLISNGPGFTAALALGLAALAFAVFTQEKQ